MVVNILTAPSWSTSAPFSSRCITQSKCPFLDAQIRGVVPYCHTHAHAHAHARAHTHTHTHTHRGNWFIVYYSLRIILLWCGAAVCLHLVRTVDFSSVLQQHFDDVGVSSTCSPDDRIHTVLLQDRRTDRRMDSVLCFITEVVVSDGTGASCINLV